MKTLTFSLPRRCLKPLGFSLVELLVAVAIGLLGILVMFQVWANWDQRKRSTASGSDAQVSGSIALYHLERDIKLAGYGFGNAGVLGCTVSAYDSARPNPDFSFTLTPVQIIDGANGAADQLITLYGNAATLSSSQTFIASSATSKKANTRTGLNKGHLAIIADSSTVCRLIEISDDTNVDSQTIEHAAGPYLNYLNSSVSSRYNPAAGYVATTQAGFIYNLGSLPQRNLWQIRRQKFASTNTTVYSQHFLTVQDDLHYTDTDADNTADWAEIGDGLINLQAEYGLDTNNDTIIDTWQATTPATWAQLKAIRFALLTRSPHYEISQTTPTAPRLPWKNSAGSDIAFTMTNLDGSTDSNPANDPNNWRHYRYRVYGSVVPLRNRVWGSSP